MLGNVGIRLTKIKTIDVLVTTHAEVCPNIILLLAGYIVENHQRVGKSFVRDKLVNLTVGGLDRTFVYRRLGDTLMRVMCVSILAIYVKKVLHWKLLMQ
ncbi:unnamed protein product [Trichogramma brassicae]|uniref:Uncharacterized protein n=1 Tax=Trichogramma brassicae TaxID=86971 RepID=A0A6H5J9M9_9HYME|nr:unnamed protein product [Trichogramma brassicae]